jgi:hypothetical protein
MIIPEREKVLKAKLLCPELDFLSFNTFNYLPEISAKLKEPLWGWNKPYLISEWGSIGWWESKKCNWGAYWEKSSTEKARFFKDLYQYTVNDPKCIGSYVFFWGEKQEKTPTWFSMFHEGMETESVGMVHQLWEGKKCRKDYPSIRHITLNGKPVSINTLLNPTSECTLSVVTDTSQLYEYTWKIRKEANEFPNHWEADLIPEEVLCKKDSFDNSIVIVTPEKEGPYRAYVTVKGKNGTLATDNFPFFVIK